jgi:arylsulfatase A-like enzyme
MLGEQGQIHKGTDRLRNQVTQLPLLVRHPEGEAAGARVAGFCQHQDIMPTVLSLMDEPIPDRVLGRNLWPQVQAAVDAGAAVAGVDQALQPDVGPAKTGPKPSGDAPACIVSAFCFHASVRTADWNYIRPWIRPSADEVDQWRLYGIRSGTEELYDLRQDAEELANVAPDHPEICAELAARLESHIKKMSGLTTGTIGGVQSLGDKMTFDGLPGLGD